MAKISLSNVIWGKQLPILDARMKLSKPKWQKLAWSQGSNEDQKDVSVAYLGGTS